MIVLFHMHMSSFQIQYIFMKKVNQDTAAAETWFLHPATG